MELILHIPYELLTLILNFLDTSSIFSLSVTSKKYVRHRIIRLLLRKKRITSIRFNAISNGYSDLLKWLISSEEVIRIANKLYTRLAAKEGHLDILVYLYENGCKWDSQTCLNAVVKDHLEIIKYLRTKFCENGWPLGTVLCMNAAKFGHLEVLKYLHETGCHWNDTSCMNAAEFGHLEVLQYLHENGCEWYEDTCVNATKNGHLEVLKYLHENGCFWDEEACYYAARFGHLEVLKYLHENGCPWDANVCSQACKSDNLDILKYLHENGCPWDQYAWLYAIEKGDDTEIIKYLHENECPWDDYVLNTFAEKGDLEALKIIHKIGRLWDKSFTVRASGEKLTKIVEYLSNNGFQCNECEYGIYCKGQNG